MHEYTSFFPGVNFFIALSSSSVVLLAICFLYLDDLVIIYKIMFNDFSDDWLSIKAAARKQVIARPIDGSSSSGQVVPLPKLSSRTDGSMLTRARKEKEVAPDPLAESFICPISLEIMTGHFLLLHS